MLTITIILGLISCRLCYPLIEDSINTIIKEPEIKPVKQIGGFNLPVGYFSSSLFWLLQLGIN